MIIKAVPCFEVHVELYGIGIVKIRTKTYETAEKVYRWLEEEKQSYFVVDVEDQKIIVFSDLTEAFFCRI